MLAIFPLLIPVVIFGQTADLSADGASDIGYSETITVTAKAPAAIEEESYYHATTSMRTEKVESSEPTRFIAQLKEVAGLDASSLGPGQRQTLTLRGAAAQQLLLLYNGVPLNSALGGGADLSLFIFNDLAAFMVLRGSEGALYGDGAMAGSVELLGQELLADYGRNSLYARVSGGSLGTWSVSGQGQVYWKNGGAQLSLGGRLWQGEFDYIDDNGTARRRTNNDGRILGSTLSVAQKLRGQSTLRAFTHVSASEKGVPGPNQLESFTARQSAIKYLLGVNLDLRPKWRYLPRFLINSHFTFDKLHFSDPQPALGPASDNLDRLITAKVGLRASFAPHSTQRLGTTLHLGITKLLAGGSYLETGRFEYHFSLFDYMTLAGGALLLRFAVALGGTNTLLKVLPDGGLRWKILRHHKNIKEMSLFIRGGRGVRFPSFYELYLVQNGLKPNPKLLEEGSWEISGGLFLDHKKMRAEVAAFHRWQENLILFVPVTATIIEAQNFAKSRAYGLEAEFSGQWYLTWAASYSYTLTRFGTGESLELPGYPRHKGSFKLGYDIHIYSWGEERNIILTPWLRGEYQSSMRIDRLNNQTEEGRILLSLGLDARFPFDIHCAFWVDNLLNKRDAVDALQYPLSGRTYMFSCGGGWRKRQQFVYQ